MTTAKTGTKESALDSIRQDAEKVKLATEWLHNSVSIARQRGASWAEIGDILGVTRQSAHERFGKRR